MTTTRINLQQSPLIVVTSFAYGEDHDLKYNTIASDSFWHKIANNLGYRYEILKRDPAQLSLSEEPGVAMFWYEMSNPFLARYIDWLQNALSYLEGVAPIAAERKVPIIVVSSSALLELPRVSDYVRMGSDYVMEANCSKSSVAQTVESLMKTQDHDAGKLFIRAHNFTNDFFTEVREYIQKSGTSSATSLPSGKTRKADYFGVTYKKIENFSTIHDEWIDFCPHEEIERSRLSIQLIKWKALHDDNRNDHKKTSLELMIKQ